MFQLSYLIVMDYFCNLGICEFDNWSRKEIYFLFLSSLVTPIKKTFQ